MNIGPAGPVKSWLDRLLELAITLVVIGLLLNWAVNLIRPLVPFFVITTTVMVTVGTIVTLLARRRNGGW